MSAAFLAGVARAHDELLRRLVGVAGARALGRLAPGGDRVAAARGAAFAAAVGVVDRVHDHAAHARALAEMPVAPGLADILVRIVGVRDSADGGHAFLTHHAKLARAEPDLGIAAVTADELGVGARRPRDLATLAGLHLDVVDDRADRHALERHRVARLHVDLAAGDDLVAHAETLGGEDVGLLAIGILDERDEGGSVGVVFDPDHDRFDIVLATLEIDDAVETLRPAAAPAHRDPSGVVPARLFRESLGEGLHGAAFPKLRTVDQNQPALARRRRFVRLECHAFCLPSASAGGGPPGSCLSGRGDPKKCAPDESEATKMRSYSGGGRVWQWYVYSAASAFTSRANALLGSSTITRVRSTSSPSTIFST